MKPSAVFIMFALSFCACSDTDNSSSGMFAFVLGDQTTAETTRQFFSGDNTQMDIRIESDNLCPDYGLELIVTGGGVEYENMVISQFPYTDLLTIPSNATIDVEAAIVSLPNTMITCVTLGNVICSFEY